MSASGREYTVARVGSPPSLPDSLSPIQMDHCLQRSMRIFSYRMSEISASGEGGRSLHRVLR